MPGDLDTQYPDAQSSLGLALWRATNAWQKHIRAALAPHDLTHVQYVLLASLTWMDRTEPVSQRHLAQHAELDVMMTSQVLRTLEAKGYIRREPHPDDRRAIALHPTPRGIELANMATQDVESADTAYFGALTPAQRELFLPALQRLASNPHE
ncbi:transcriptional regulator, MarR family [Agreia bicolorata]|uniref:Transcriptional regulator, MarR family n=1 Tax=Agreia bicolorata TaxID=110935 RepID=A0A1T4Y1T2_9MICO|nr:MarR family transcriptional regulator [Agreia bicolorata]SKA95749.1 transcriptional regulator, MarR family [Agreia bicolorata]